MATKYWRGGAGTWNATTSTNWSDTSGGAGGAIAPCALDDVIFNSASNNNAYTVTIAAGAVCRSLTIAGPNTGNVTVAGTGALGIFGGLTIAATGVTRTYTGAITFRSTTNGNTITTNGVALASTIVFDGVGGGWSLGSALSNAGSIQFTNGTFSTANFNLTSSSGTISTPGANGFTINFGSSTISFSGLSITNDNCVINAGTSSITTSGLSMSGNAVRSFYDVIFTGNLSRTFAGTLTFRNLTFPTLGANILVTNTLSGNITITGTLTVSGTGAIARYMFLSDVVGTSRTMTVASISSLTDVDFRDITAAGTSVPWSGTRLGNCLGNTNISFGTGVNKFWNLAAGGAWNAAAWATTSGGTASTLNFPLPQDTAIIENTGLNAGASITAFQNYNLGGLNSSTRTNAATISGSTPIKLYGNYSLGTGADFSSAYISFEGRSTQTATSNGKQWLGITINCAGTVSLSDAMLNIANFTFTKGTLTTNNFNMSITSSISFTSSESKIWNLGSSTITSISFGSTTSGLNVTINAGTSTISISGNSTTQGFEGQNTTFNNMTHTSASYATHDFRGNNTFNNLTFTAPTTTGVSTLRLFGNITANGTIALGGGTSVTQRMVILSGLPDSTFTISAATVTGLTDIDFRDITATGTANWTTGTRLGNCGGNTGITFPVAKTVYWNLTGTQNWSATAWATTSGGTPAINNFPLAQDTAIFNNAGAATTVTINAVWHIGNISAGTRTTAWTLAGTSSISIYGDVTYGSGVTATNTGQFIFNGKTNQSFTTAGKSLSSGITIQKSAGSFTHADAYTSTASIVLTLGTYNTQNFNITASQLTAVGSGSIFINLGSSTITFSGASFWSANSATVTLNSGTSSIILTNTSNKTLSSIGSFTFYNLSNNGGTNTTALIISGNNTFNTLSNTANQNLELDSGKTQTVANFNYTGTVGNVVDIRSSTPGLQATLLKNSGPWYAGANSTNGGNNSGWTFTAGGSTNYAYIKDIVAAVTSVAQNSNFFFFLR